MKTVLLFFIFLSFKINAQDFEYQDFSDNYKKTAYQIRANLKLNGMSSFYEKTNSPHELVDQVFEGHGFEIFLKVGMHPEKGIQIQSFVSFKEGFLYHDIVDGIPIAIYFRNLDLNDAKEYKKRILKFFAKKITVFDLIIPSANAAECNFAEGLTPSVQLVQASRISEKFQMDLILANTTSCVMNALSGAWRVTGGLATNIVSGAWSFIKSPIKSAERFWDSAVDTYEKTKTFISNFKSQILELKETLVQMPLQAQIDLICNIVGSVGTATLVGILTGGPAGMLRGVASLATKVSQIRGVASAIGIISKLKLPTEKISELLKKVVESTNKKGLEDLEFMAKNDMNRITMEIAQCAL